MRNQYPLAWPAGWHRTNFPERSRFGVTSTFKEEHNIELELRRLGATRIVITSNMQHRQDGVPYSRQTLSDYGVAVYFMLEGEEQCIPCDKWDVVRDNLRAITRTIEALRGLERWGTKEMVNAAFRGFKALPSDVIVTRPYRSWFVVLGIDEHANVLEVKAAYREQLKIHHPDVGGQIDDFSEIQRAYKEWRNL